MNHSNGIKMPFSMDKMQRKDARRFLSRQGKAKAKEITLSKTKSETSNIVN